jgi:hypothetical protein
MYTEQFPAVVNSVNQIWFIDDYNYVLTHCDLLYYDIV